jgi:hypothetical protein
MDGPNPESSKKCSWCGALNPADAPACSKCDAALSALQPLVSASPFSIASPTLDQENRAPYQDIVTPLVDSSLFDLISGEAIRNLGLGPSFEPGGTRAFFVAGCLSLYILLSLVAAFVDFSRIELLSKIAARVRVPPEQVTNSDALTLLIRLSLVVVVLLTTVSFLAWIYRAHKNLKALGAMDLKYSPGWAIGGFFVPLLNMVRPYQVVIEIWKASASEAHRSRGTVWGREETPVFISLWWGSWLISGFIDSFGRFMIFGAEKADQLLVASRYRLAYDVISMACAALAITVVLRINARQEDTNRVNSLTESRRAPEPEIVSDQL